jgi:hypothetical protein
MCRGSPPADNECISTSMAHQHWQASYYSAVYRHSLGAYHMLEILRSCADGKSMHGLQAGSCVGTG